MLVPLIVSSFGGVLLGGMIGHAKSRKPLAGAVIGAACGAGLAFAIYYRPGEVAAVDTLDDFEAQVLRSPRPVLVDFYSDRCGPCRKLHPTIKKLAAKYKGKVDVVKIDVMAAPEITHAFGIRSIPHVILFIHGRPTHRWVGNRPTSDYQTVIDSVLSAR